MKAIRPWAAGTECPEAGYAEFKQALNAASYHNAAPSGERGQARAATRKAADIAIEQDWPYWAMERMFSDISPLVDWSSFMQNYINILKHPDNT